MMQAEPRSGALFVFVGKRRNQTTQYILRRAKVHYRWHPLYGETLRIRRRKRDDGQSIVDAERASGETRELPAWMTDAETCSTMILGRAQLSLHALQELARS